MTATHPHRPAHLMIRPFPIPGPQVQLAYQELHLAINGTEEQRKQVGNPALLPKPWEPGSCLEPKLRRQVWDWLDAVVVWLNTEYTWDAAAAVPTCWPFHPHLVHEIAVVADQRRRAGLGLTSDALEEWHRYCLPAFSDRIRNRIKAHCDDEHVSWPGRSRHNQHTSPHDNLQRQEAYDFDVRPPELIPSGVPRLGVVDPATGEIHDPADDQDIDVDHDDPGDH